MGFTVFSNPLNPRLLPHFTVLREFLPRHVMHSLISFLTGKADGALLEALAPEEIAEFPFSIIEFCTND